MYANAYDTVKQWDAMSPDQKKGRMSPKGQWIKLVRSNEKQLLMSQFEEREADLKAEGRA